MKQGWEVKKLSDIAKINYGYTEKAIYEEIGPKFLRITDIQDKGVDWNNVPYCKCNEIDLAKYKLEAGDVVFARTGATTGKSNLIRNPPNAVFASYLIKLRLKDKSNFVPEYISYFFQTQSYWDVIKNGISGSTQGGFNAAKLGIVEIPIPPLPEQERIVSILDKAFSAIEQAKQNVEKNLKNAKELFDSYLNGIFTNKGDDWEEKKLGDICENLDSKRVPITKSSRVAGCIPYYGASGIVDYVGDYIFNEDLLCVSEDGANLIARTYPIAFSISGKTWVNNHAHVLKFSNIITQKLVELYLNSIKLDDYVSGMAQPKLNQTMLNRKPIPVPSLPEQERIVQKINNLSIETKRLEKIYQQKLIELEELKKSIIQKAFNGELVA